MADKNSATIVIKKKKAGGHGHHGGAWKVAYADFVTAMMAFFMVMWLMGADEETKKSIEGYFKDPGSQSPISTSPEAPKGGQNLNVFEDRNPAGGRPMDMPAGKVNTKADEEKELQELKETLEETISMEVGVANHSEHLEMVYDSKGLVLRIAVKNFFLHGESEVRPDLLPVLVRIGKIVSRTKRLIRIEGHTDKTELTRDGKPDWGLSTERAAWVADYWMKQFPAMAPSRVQVAGNAHFRPLEDGDSQQALSENRRIEVIVLNDLYK